jgi:hypothetical protein
MRSPKIIRATSSEVRTAFAQWLAHDLPTEIKVVILEGLTASGKTTLTKQPFVLDGRPSTNIAMDSFLARGVEEATPYLTAVDQPAMLENVQDALGHPALVILEGAIVWPAVEPVTTKLGVNGVRRVYLKRMAHFDPNFWADEDFISDPEWWPPGGFHRSIYRYHSEQSPWLNCDLIIERIEEKHALPE